jgi:hypothetical protein
MIDLQNVNIASLVIDGIDYRDAPDYCDAYYSYGEYDDGTEIGDGDLEQFQYKYPDVFYETVLKTIY